jgi:hypothetical protein
MESSNLTVIGRGKAETTSNIEPNLEDEVKIVEEKK